ncbi:MAG: hypothetical protein HC785_00830 [Calothrix sp. CSU_2_0]|nr:hypothetical protein [Calothrix sp. CSU_2_0]
MISIGKSDRVPSQTRSLINFQLDAIARKIKASPLAHCRMRLLRRICCI